MAEPNDDDTRRRLEEAVRHGEQRRATWEKEGERPLWKTLSMIGALGWLIVTPTLIGVFAGRLLDGALGTARWEPACCSAGRWP